MRSVVVTYDNKAYKFDLMKIENPHSGLVDFIFKAHEHSIFHYSLVVTERVIIQSDKALNEFHTTNEFLLKDVNVFNAFKQTLIDFEVDFEAYKN